MTRALVTVLVLVLAIVIGLALGERIDGPDDAPVRVHTTESTSTTWVETQPSLGEGFDRLVAAMRPKPRARARTAPTVVVPEGAWACGGSDLPPCWVLDRENPGRDATVYNKGCHHEAGYLGSNNPCNGRVASTASGIWQFVRSTWARFKGYVNAADAPWWVQVEKTKLTWDHGRGCAHWNAC